MSIWKGRSNPQAVYHPVTFPFLQVGPSNFSPPHMPTGHTETFWVVLICGSVCVCVCVGGGGGGGACVCMCVCVWVWVCVYKTPVPLLLHAH